MSELFDLGSLASALYKELLRDPGATSEALEDVVGADGVLSVADQLVRLNLLTTDTSAPSGYRALTASVAVEAVLARQEADLAAQQLRMERSRVVAAQLIAETAAVKQDASDQNERLSGIDEIRLRLRLLAERASETVCSFSPGSPRPEDLEASREPNARLLERGVRVRTVYQDSVRADPLTRGHLTRLVSKGAEVRTCPTLPLRMIVFDGHTAVVPTVVGSARDGAVVLRSAGAVAAMTALFDTVWASAMPTDAAPVLAAHGLNASERAALDMLAAGHTDAYVASRLGVSDRTARRIASDIMERLGARSRFEAGILAERSGWLPGAEVTPE